jgi:hypothetical protein
MLARICSWCGCRLPAHPGDELEPDATSHGICGPCSVRAEAEGSLYSFDQPARHEDYPPDPPPPAPVPYLLHRARMGRPPTGTSRPARLLCDQVTAGRYRAAAARLDAPLSQVMRMAIGVLELAEEEIAERIGT